MAKSRGTSRRVVLANESISDIRLVEIWLYLLGVIWWLLTVVFRAWSLNPVSLLYHRMKTMYMLDGKSDLPIQPRWTDRIRDLFISDVQRKIRLLQWVKSRVTHIKIDDFIYSWQDGIALCALLESVSPGLCPRYYLLKSVLRVNNCKFGLQIANKFLDIQRVVITPEEMAIAAEDTELKIVHLVQMIRWKHQRMPKSSTPAHAVALPVRRVLSRCFARGTGLKTAMVGRRAKFNIITDDEGTLDLLVEIIGPLGEMNSERISSLHPEISSKQQHETTISTLKPPSEPRSKVIEDSEGNKFIRQKSFDEDSNQIIPFDYQSIGEGRFLVTYVPRNTGVHDIVIKSHDHHIQGSPYQVSVSDWSSSWNVLGKSKPMTLGMLPSISKGPAKMKQLQEEVSNRFLDAGVRSRRHRGHSKQLTIGKRRVVKRVITRNGEEIVLSDFSPSPTLSRQSSAEFSDLSEEEQNRKDCIGKRLTWQSGVKHANNAGKGRPQAVKEDIYIPEDETYNDTSDSLSAISIDSDCIKKKPLSKDINKGKAVHECVPESNGRSFCSDSKQNSSHKSSVHCSVSDKMGRAVEPVRYSRDEINENCMAGVHQKLLQSDSHKKSCDHMKDTTIIDDDSNCERPVTAHPRPNMFKLQMSRQWQSFDVDQLPKDSPRIEYVNNTCPKAKTTRDSSCQNGDASKDNDDKQVAVKATAADESILSEHSGRTETLLGRSTKTSCQLQSKEGKEDQGRSHPSVSSSSTITPTGFKSIVDQQSPYRSWTNSQVVIVVPRAKVDKTTQVTNEEIKNATGWHSGAFKIKKRKIYINTGNIQQQPQAAESDIPLNGDDIEGSLNGNINAQERQRNVFNVEEWLHSNGSDIFRAPSDRQSTFDTIDSGIADENISLWNHGGTNGRRRISRRQRPHEIQLVPSTRNYHQRRRRLQFQRGSQRRVLHSSLSEIGSKLVECSNEELNFSDSELEYSSRRNRKHNRAQFRSQNSCHGDTLRQSMIAIGRDTDGANMQYLKRNRSVSGQHQFHVEAASRKGQAFFGWCGDQSKTGNTGTVAVSDTVRISSKEPERVRSSDKSADDELGLSTLQRSHFVGETNMLRNVEDHFKNMTQKSRTCGTGSDRLDGNKLDRNKQPSRKVFTSGPVGTPTQGNDSLNVQSGKQDGNQLKEQANFKAVKVVRSPTEHIESSSCLNDSPVVPLSPNNPDVNIQECSLSDSRRSGSDVVDEAWFSKFFPKSVLQLLENNPFSETTGGDERLPGDLSEEEECLAFGAGLSYGLVGMKNNFQVWVRYPCNGIVNISVHGPDPRYITETSTTYTGDNLYEVMYEVTHPGYYVITVKWCDQNVANSPFITKVAWD